MSTYLSWNQKIISDFSDQNINNLYHQGYVFTRTGKGEMYQTRSLRIDLHLFKESSENRRILKKTEEIILSTEPIPYPLYDWTVGKLGKDFYTTKFGDGTFSANKIKELITDEEKTNFNKLFVYSVIARSDAGATKQSPELQNQLIKQTTSEKMGIATSARSSPPRNDTGKIGYCIASETSELVHYCYPFYELQPTSYQLPANLGLGMMLKAILYAKEQGKKYVYLGSAQRPSDTYKLQFSGLEWFDGKTWKHDLDELKNILNEYARR